MFKNRLLKVLAMLMVLNILIIPLTSFLPQEQNKYTVHAGELVDIRFYNAIVAMVGITSAGLLYMSQSFSIPEVDMVALRDQFQTTLDADVTKKAAWMTAQTEYLSGGVAKTMGASELAKIGVNDIYNQFMTYIKSNVLLFSQSGSVLYQSGDTKMTIDNKCAFPFNDFGTINLSSSTNGLKALEEPYAYSSNNFNFIKTYVGSEMINAGWMYQSYDGNVVLSIQFYSTLYKQLNQNLINYYSSQGALFVGSNAFLDGIKGNVTNTDNIINTDSDSISLIPIIPWIGTDIPTGTVVTPAISAPYAGAVPIDVPITAPIDPPIDDPIDPPSDTTLLGTVAAILAALVPISGLLDNIDVGIDGLSGTITEGIDSVIDGIGDIFGTLTGGITSSLTDIQSSISTLFDPPTETLNLDKLKNLNSVLFTKFPFSIPFDFMRMIGSFSGDPVAPVLKIPFDMSSFGGENTMLEFDLSQFDYIASIVRQISFIGFVFFMLFNTRKLIWK